MAQGWTYVLLHRFGGLPSWLADLSVLLLSLFLSVYLALAAGCAGCIGGGGKSGKRDAIALGACGSWLLAHAMV